MKNIYIFGSGGFAKEVYFLVNEINKSQQTYRFAGFIDVNPEHKSIKIGSREFEVFNETEFFSNAVDHNSCFAIGMGNPAILNKLNRKYAGSLDFPNLVHPGVIGLFESIQFGKGNIVTAGCIFTADITIGSFNIFNLNSTIGHDVVMGNCNVINPGVNISGGVEIGNENLVGTNAAILQYLKIGNGNTIGAGSMLRNNVDDRKVLVGIPAKVIKENN